MPDSNIIVNLKQIKMMKKHLLILTALVIVTFSNCKKDTNQPTIEYPSSGFYGENILDTTKTTYLGEEFSLAANLSYGAELKVRISALGNEEWGWFYAVGTEQNWQISDFDESSKSQLFIAINTDQKCDLEIGFYSGQYLIEYFELNSDLVTREKIIEKQTAYNSK